MFSQSPEMKQRQRGLHNFASTWTGTLIWPSCAFHQRSLQSVVLDCKPAQTSERQFICDTFLVRKYVKSEIDSAKPCRDQRTTDSKAAACQTACAERSNERGKLLLRETNTEQDADGRRPARWRNGQRFDRMV